MKTKNYLWSMLTMIMVAMLSVSMVSCGGDDGNDNPNNGQPVNPGTDVADPTGTISLSMRNANNGTTYIDNVIYINKSDNFDSYNGVYFASVGQVKGLGNVSTIPSAGWASQVAVKPNNGYVAFYNGIFYRLYVEDFIEGTSGGVIGADIKYQKPFKGVDEAIQLPQTAVTANASGGGEDIIFKNKSILVYDASADQPWCTVNKCSTNDYYFLYNGVHINCQANTSSSSREATVTIETAYKKKVTIKVTQPGQDPFISLGEENIELTAKEQTLTKPISTNIDGSDLQVSGATSWCKAEIVSETQAKLAVRWIGNEPVEGTRATTNTSQSYNLKLEVSENTSESERSANIVIKSSKSNAKATMKITQKGVTFEVSKNLVMFDKNNSNQTLTITTTASNWEAKSSASWCTFSVNGNQLTIRATATTTNREAKITFPGFKQEIVVNQSKYAVGDNYNEGNITGTVGYMGNGDANADYRLIYKDVGSAAWSTEKVATGATDQYDGRKNVEIIKKISNWKELYPAFALCDALNTGGVTGWYLPASIEQQNVGSRLPRKQNTDYWTSTEASGDNAKSWDQDFFWFRDISKGINYQVRAVHHF